MNFMELEDINGGEIQMSNVNKDWLKDKEEQLKSATVFVNENGNEAVEVSVSVLNKLFEQAERSEVLAEQYDITLEENKVYREAIERALQEGVKGDCDAAINRIYGILGKSLEDGYNG